MGVIHIKSNPKSIFEISLLCFVILFPFIISIIKPKESVHIKSYNSGFAMSAMRAETDPYINNSSEKKPRIPKLIHQTVKSKLSIPSDIQKNINSWKEMNPGWKHILYDDEDMLEFMEIYHPDSVEVYKSLESIVEKTDMWRYSVLDTFGGVYADTDTLCLKPIDEWWGEDNNSTVIIGIEAAVTPYQMKKYVFTELIQFCQWTMASSPGHPIVHNMPYYIYRHMRLERLGVDNYDDPKLSVLHRTGPGIWTDAIFDYIIQQGYDPRDVVEGASIGDVKFLNKNGFANIDPLPKNLNDMPSDAFVYHLFYGSWKE